MVCTENLRRPSSEITEFRVYPPRADVRDVVVKFNDRWQPTADGRRAWNREETGDGVSVSLVDLSVGSKAKSQKFAG